jgi:hypothetical protein
MVEQIGPGFDPLINTPICHPFGLEQGEKAFLGGVVSTVARSADQAGDAAVADQPA